MIRSSAADKSCSALSTTSIKASATSGRNQFSTRMASASAPVNARYIGTWALRMNG